MRYSDEIAQEFFLEIKRTYSDRKMMKWNGFYLSDETAEIEKDRKKREKINHPKVKMTPEAIDLMIRKSFIQNFRIAIQMDELDRENHFYDDLIGIVVGQNELGIYLEQDDHELVNIDVEQIRNIEQLLPNKILFGGES